MQVIHLLSVWLSGGEEESKTLHKKLDETLDTYAAGGLEHAAEAISCVWDLARKNQALPSAPKGHKEVYAHRVDTPERMGIRDSLIGLMQGRTVDCRGYWARRSRRGIVGPIHLFHLGYMSGLKISQVDAREWDCVWVVTSVLSRTVLECDSGSDSHLEENGEYSFSEDSDCESESEGDGGPVSRDAEVGHERGKTPLRVLKVGSLIT